MNNLSKNLREYAKSGNYPFHMPGHKRQLPGAYQYDITEIEGFDDLNDPTGIIDEMNKDIGIRKEIDRLGRLVIPKEMREIFGMDKTVELVMTQEGILIRNPQYALVEINEKS